MRDHYIYASLNYKATEDSNKLVNMLNGLIATTLFLFLNFKAIYFFFLNIIFHYYMRWLTARDPYKRDFYNRYINFSDEYDPWINEKLEPYGDRPYGFGKNLTV